jgi:hypothetical protein
MAFLMTGSMGVKGQIISSDLCLSIEGSSGRASGWVYRGVWMVGTQMYCTPAAEPYYKKAPPRKSTETATPMSFPVWYHLLSGAIYNFTS